jgi:hypothetical protein
MASSLGDEGSPFLGSGWNGLFYVHLKAVCHRACDPWETWACLAWKAIEVLVSCCAYPEDLASDPVRMLMGTPFEGSLLLHSLAFPISICSSLPLSVAEDRLPTHSFPAPDLRVHLEPLSLLVQGEPGASEIDCAAP